MPVISVWKADEESVADPRSADQLIRKLLAPLGGGEFYFCSGERVVLLADASLPAENDTGANFDLRLLWALIQYAKSCGSEDITVCLRPEESFTGEQVLQHSGYGRLAELSGVKVVTLDRVEATPHATDTGLVLEEAEIYDVLNLADVVISLAKYKEADGHMFGGALANIAYAARPLEGMDYAMYQRALTDIYSILAPDLTIVDCIKGKGGFQTNPVSCVLAGSDAVAVDTVLCALSDLDMQAHESLQICTQYGMGVSNPSEIGMCGDDLRLLMADAPADPSTMN